MREHLYKAKRANWRELPENEWWVEGNLLISDEDYYIIPNFGVSCVEKLNNYVCDKLITLHAYEVDKETVCKLVKPKINADRIRNMMNARTYTEYDELDPEMKKIASEIAKKISVSYRIHCIHFENV